MLTAAELAQRNEGPQSDNPIFILRSEYGLTLQQVADAIGVTKPMVWAWERDGNITVINAIKLARFYETTVENLFGHLVKDEAV